jgi:DNA-binding transcriptional ArsR family regulator
MTAVAGGKLTTQVAARESPNDEQVQAAVRLLSLLADETRLRLLWAMSHRECDVTSLVALTGSTKTSTSQHLARLRDAELVSVRREGRRAFYRLRSGHLRKLIREALQQADHQLLGLPPHD